MTEPISKDKPASAPVPGSPAIEELRGLVTKYRHMERCEREKMETARIKSDCYLTAAMEAEMRLDRALQQENDKDHP